MIKIDQHIEIVRSTKSWLSSMSSVSCDAIYGVLAKRYSRVGVTIVNTTADLEALVASKPDLVFLGMKFIPNDRSQYVNDPATIWIPEYLDQHGMVYTGSSKQAHELELDKALAKQCVLNAGLQTSPFYVARQDQIDNSDTMPLKFPVFIKPTNRGGGLGIDSASVARNPQEMRSKIQSIASTLQTDSLIEEYLPGREFSVALLKDKHSSDFVMMPIELIAEPDQHGTRLLSGQVKSSDTERIIGVTDRRIRSQVNTLAMNVFRALGARDYGRVDIRLDRSGTPQFLEANLIPGLISGYGYFPRACMLNMHLDYESMILHIVQLALARNLTNDSRGHAAHSDTLHSLDAVLQPLSL